MLDPASFGRVLAFAAVYAGIEYRYVNRWERGLPEDRQGEPEKPAFWVVLPYHVYFLLPAFVVVSFALPPTAWAGNGLLLAVAEDVAYFCWRRKWVAPGEWTTTLMGSLNAGEYAIPLWWPVCLAAAAALYAAPF